MIGHLKISKREFYALGGFARVGLWRRFRQGAWQHFIDTTLIKNDRGKFVPSDGF